MNTLSDTDEGKARPSVWPVYVAAVVIGLTSLHLCCMLVTQAYVDSSLVLSIGAKVLFMLAVYWPLTIYMLLGILASWGILRFRPWGWWCGVLWTITLAIGAWWFLPGIYFLFLMWHGRNWGTLAREIAEEIGFTVAGLSILVLLVLVTWPLATRRRLFFPRA